MQLDHLYKEAEKQGTHQICYFMEDMDEAGIEMEFYVRKDWWRGPAVRVLTVEEVTTRTEVICQSDPNPLGVGFIVYPTQSLG